MRVLTLTFDFSPSPIRQVAHCGAGGQSHPSASASAPRAHQGHCSVCLDQSWGATILIIFLPPGTRRGHRAIGKKSNIQLEGLSSLMFCMISRIVLIGAHFKWLRWNSGTLWGWFAWRVGESIYYRCDIILIEHITGGSGGIREKGRGRK